jgi:hypothetical protein
MSRVLLNKMIVEFFGVDRSDVTRSTERRCYGAALEQQEEYCSGGFAVLGAA